MTQEETTLKLLEEKLKGQRIANSEAKNEWWKSTLKFISGGLLVILTGFVNMYPKTSELETKITSLEKDVSFLKIQNDSVKILNKNLKIELVRFEEQKH
jgi:hypothetical protein|tara:strand:+ start:708 stop:1004 length:297 start_codon:yes stop_codon:yes gene_type:complete